MNKTSDSERGNSGAPEVPPFVVARAVKPGTGIDLLTRLSWAGELCRLMVTEHEKGLQALKASEKAITASIDLITTNPDNLEGAIKEFGLIQTELNVLSCAALREGQLINSFAEALIGTLDAMPKQITKEKPLEGYQ
jgi:hypothetical protein